MLKYNSKFKILVIMLILIICTTLYFVTDLSSTLKTDYLNFFSVAEQSISKEGLFVHFIDVGTADSILITDKYENVLVDTGNESLRSKSLEYLKDNSIDKIDIMFLTHFDRDHIGSTVDIIHEIEVDKIIVPVGFIDEGKENKLVADILQTVKEYDIQLKEISAYTDIKMSNYKFEIFSPLYEYIDSNDNSIVSRLVYGDTSFLLTGDVASKAEADILSTYEDIKADVLKVAHHGSGTSSSKEFIKAVSPEYAVISVGDNYYGLPSYTVINSIEQVGAEVLRTDIDGTVVFYSDGSNLNYYTQYSNMNFFN